MFGQKAVSHNSLTVMPFEIAAFIRLTEMNSEG
jgi:hypothetical protein